MSSWLDNKQALVADQSASQDELITLLGLQLDELIRIRTALEQVADKAHGIQIPTWLRRK